MKIDDRWSEKHRKTYVFFVPARTKHRKTRGFVRRGKKQSRVLRWFWIPGIIPQTPISVFFLNSLSYLVFLLSCLFLLCSLIEKWFLQDVKRIWHLRVFSYDHFLIFPLLFQYFLYFSNISLDFLRFSLIFFIFSLISSYFLYFSCNLFGFKIYFSISNISVKLLVFCVIFD